MHTHTLYLKSLNISCSLVVTGRRFGVIDLGPEVINYVSHATQQRLQNLLEKVTVVAQQKNITFKVNEHSFCGRLCVRGSLVKLFNELFKLYVIFSQNQFIWYLIFTGAHCNRFAKSAEII